LLDQIEKSPSNARKNKPRKSKLRENKPQENNKPRKLRRRQPRRRKDNQLRPQSAPQRLRNLAVRYFLAEVRRKPKSLFAAAGAAVEMAVGVAAVGERADLNGASSAFSRHGHRNACLRG
jgi:hypothetical protein